MQIASFDRGCVKILAVHSLLHVYHRDDKPCNYLLQPHFAKASALLFRGW